MSKPWLIILAGGTGTRFWPRSRASKPKQLLKIFGDKSLLEITIQRFSGWIPNERIIIACTQNLKDSIKSALVNYPGIKVSAEPFGKNTAPCLAMAMAEIKQQDPESTAIVVAADSWIDNTEGYLKTMKVAVAAAEEQQNLITIGITPSRAETGYGYLRAGESMGNGVFSVARFVEKPSKEVAETMIQNSEYHWNAGMFVWTANSFFRELEACNPDLAKSFEKYSQAMEAKSGADEALVAAYEEVESISIDYALMEKSKRVSMATGSFDWSDLGSFLSLNDVYPKCEGGVGRAKRVMALDSVANIVDVPQKTVALLGVTNMMVVDVGDVLLIAAKEKAQEVKRFVERLRDEGDPEKLL